MSSSKPDPSLAGLSYIEILDVENQRHNHEMDRLKRDEQRQLALESERTERARYETRRSRHMTIAYVGIAFAIAFTLVGLGYVFFGIQPPGPTNEQIEQQRERECIASGGGYVAGDILTHSDRGMCVFPGKRVESPPDE